MSFGASPTAPSLLIPSNPAFITSESAPRGGILINVHRASETAVPSISLDRSLDGDRSSEAGSPITPSFAPEPSSPMLSSSPGANGKLLKIRFAPLPDPRRPRSLSTGRNLAWTAQIGEDGEERRGFELKNHEADADPDVDPNESAIADDEEGEDGEGSEDGGSDGTRRGRSWSKTMGSSWKGTKKLLTVMNPVASSHKEKEEVATYEAGAPLKKSVSTGGFIGSSPFRWTSETERRRSMQGPAPPTVTSLLSAHRPSASTSSTTASPGHRRMSSLEPGTTPLQRSTSPNLTPIKMMNGRVYGSRRASEAAAREKEIRERSEPAFVEWGQGEVAGAAKPPEETTGSRGFLGDMDDGGGMAWVKRRREERQKKEQEDKEKREKEAAAAPEAGRPPTGESGGEDQGLSSSQSSTSSLDIGENVKRRHVTTDLKTPAIPASDLPPAPIIQVSNSEPVLGGRALAGEIVSPTSGGQNDAFKSDLVGPKGERMTPTPPSSLTPSGIATPSLSQAGTGGDLANVNGHGHAQAQEQDQEHVVQAMRIPSDSAKKAQAKGKPVDVFGHVSSNGREHAQRQHEYDDDDDDEEDDEEDDGDFEEDEDEELAERTTSSAAGVEVISRHK